jgi:heme o synthase
MSDRAAVLARPGAQLLRDYFDLSKPGIGFYAVITTFTSFWMATQGPLDLWLLAHTLLATALVTAGGGALNQVMEIQADSDMRRTENRPLPSGRVSPEPALAFGVITSIGGVLWLYLSVNGLTSLLAILTLIGYLFVYTPLKKTTHLATIVGAFPGAIPILIGWTAVYNSIDARGWVLFGILFLWQIPHFLAIAWMYRNDYARAGFPMLTVVEPDGIQTGYQAVIYLAALIPLSLLPTILGMTGILYFSGALVLGLGFFAAGIQIALRRNNPAAKQLLFASILYLPLLLILMIIDKV